MWESDLHTSTVHRQKQESRASGKLEGIELALKVSCVRFYLFWMLVFSGVSLSSSVELKKPKTKKVKWRRGVRSRGSTTQPPTGGKHGAIVRTSKVQCDSGKIAKKIAFLKHGATMCNSKIFGAIWKSREKHNFPQRRQDFEAFRLFVIPCRMCSHHISKCLRTSGTRQGEPSCDSSFRLRL